MQRESAQIGHVLCESLHPLHTEVRKAVQFEGCERRWQEWYICRGEGGVYCKRCEIRQIAFVKISQDQRQYLKKSYKTIVRIKLFGGEIRRQLTVGGFRYFAM